MARDRIRPSKAIRRGARVVTAACVVGAVVTLTAGLEAAPPKRVASLGHGSASPPRCPRHMAPVVSGEHAFCIDRYEDAVVEVGEHGRTTPHSPYEPVTGKKVKAVSAPGMVPQGYISGAEAKAACEHAGKRLCAPEEWELACRGRRPTTYPYGDEEIEGRCNDEAGRKVHPVVELFKDSEEPFHDFATMNDARINQLPHTVSKTGAHASCKSSFGVYDMVGNLHEWTSDPKGQFRGGYFMDTHKNGDGCGYRTVAHDPTYHDYSTGFRCCR
jgi:formylglycine-generating enzyme required for sulfatase activity